MHDALGVIGHRHAAFGLLQLKLDMPEAVADGRLSVVMAGKISRPEGFEGWGERG
jgi:hypothetical protein